MTMGLDIAKLENVSRKSDGRIIARCPACAAEGNDSNGEHLAVFPDGRFGCVVYPQDKAHTKEIFRLVGLKGGAIPTREFEVNPVAVPPSKPIMDLGRFSIDRLKRQEPKPQAEPASLSPVPAEHVAPPVELTARRTEQHDPDRHPGADHLKDLPQEIREFLMAPVGKIHVRP